MIETILHRFLSIFLCSLSTQLYWPALVKEQKGDLVSKRPPSCPVDSERRACVILLVKIFPIDRRSTPVGSELGSFLYTCSIRESLKCFGRHFLSPFWRVGMQCSCSFKHIERKLCDQVLLRWKAHITNHHTTIKPPQKSAQSERSEGEKKKN